MQKVGTILEDPETLTSLVIDKNKSDVNIVRKVWILRSFYEYEKT